MEKKDIIMLVAMAAVLIGGKMIDKQCSGRTTSDGWHTPKGGEPHKHYRPGDEPDYK